MINYYTMKEGNLVKCEECQDKEYIYWIEMIKPTFEEIESISKKYNFPSKYLEDIKDSDEIARVEGLDDCDIADLFMLSYPLKIEDDNYTTRVMSIVLSKEVLVTAIDYDMHLLEDYHLTDNKLMSIANARENLILEIAWSISQKFIMAVKNLNLEILKLENTLKKTSKTEAFYRIINIKKSIIDFDQAIDNNGPVIEEVYNSDRVFNTELSQDMLFDMQIEYRQAKNMIVKAVKMLEQLSDLYSSVISNNLNDVMKILTSITIVLTVPTIIGGYWGMNVTLPISESPYSFYYLVGLSLAISFLIIYWLRKKEFL